MTTRHRSLAVALALLGIALLPVRCKLGPLLPGISYSPFVAGNPSQGEIADVALIDRTLERLAPYVGGWVRTFTVGNGLDRVGEKVHALGLKAAVQMWVGPADEDGAAANLEQRERLIELANEGAVDLAIVGSEVLLRGDLSSSALIAHMEAVRAAIPAEIPVATAEIWTHWLAHPELIAATDILLVNIYPYFEHTAVTDAVRSLHCSFERVRHAAAGKDVWLAETGWPSAGPTLGDAVASEENAAFYLKSMMTWAALEAYPMLYFEAFDEPWKIVEGAQGPHWGIWTKDLELKPGMEAALLYGETVEDTWHFDEVPGGPGAPSIEHVAVPAYGTSALLSGRVAHVSVLDALVTTYLRVDGRWWGPKPGYDAPLTRTDCDATWTTEIVTGGNDAQATTITSFLVPAGFDPPDVMGDPAASLPQQLYDEALDWVETERAPTVRAR